MIYTLFFNRHRADMVGDKLKRYDDHAANVYARAVAHHPGFIDQKAYTADDGERLVVVRFRDLESLNGWRDDPIHVEAKEEGRQSYYDEYRLVICEDVRDRAWKREPRA